MGTWYTFIAHGSNPGQAKGPHRSEDDAMEALRRFRNRYGAGAGTFIAAGSVRLAGPFATRREAQVANINTHAGRSV